MLVECKRNSLPGNAADQDADDILQHALNTERKLRDRNSQLVVPNKSFAHVRAVCEQQLQLMRQPLVKQQVQRSRPAVAPAWVWRLSLPCMCIFTVCMCGKLRPPLRRLSAPFHHSS